MPTDTLTTILQIQGVAQAVASLQAVGAAAQSTSNTLLRLTTIQAPLTGGMLRLNLANTLAAGGFTLIFKALYRWMTGPVSILPGGGHSPAPSYWPNENKLQPLS